jgi:ABC-2 type transport system permease protein
MRRVWLIARKDLKEGFGQRALVLRLLVPVVLLPIFYAVVTGLALRKYQANPHDASVLGGMIALWGAIVALLGTFFGNMIAAQAIALEKTKRTIEGLLATPVSDREIFAGKVLAAYLPGIVAGYGSGLLYWGIARVVSGVEPLVLPGVSFAAWFIVAILPIVVAIETSIGVIVSARSGSVTTATQLASLFGMPVIGLVVYVAYRASGWPQWQLLVLGAGLLALVAILIPMGARALGREEIMARLD